MDRYVVQQPMTLASLSEEKLRGWITTGAYAMMELYIAEASRDNDTEAERILSQHIQGTCEYLDSYMPRKFHDGFAGKIIEELEKLLKEIETKFPDLEHEWGPPNVRMEIIGRTIEIVMFEHLTSLSLDQRHLRHMKQFMPTLLNNSHILSNLTHLDVICFQKFQIKHLLKHLHKLKSLSLSCDLVTLDLIRCVTTNCKLLESINFISLVKRYFECDDDDDFFWREILKMLCQMKNLKLLNLQASMAYSIANSIKELWLSCENLEHLSIKRVFTIDPSTHIGNDEIALALQGISMEFPEKRFKIKHYTLQEETALEQLELVGQMCPLIERVSINVLHLLLPLDLVGPVLHQMENLRELDLQRCNFQYNPIKEILTVMGSKLVQLHLLEVQDIDLKALQCISETCPNLESLQIKCVFETGENSDLDETIELDFLPFNHLRRLICHGFFDERFYFYLLSSCPNVEYLTVPMPILSENLLLRVLDKISLTYLREVRLETDLTNLDRSKPVTDLTPLVTQKLIQNSVNPLVIVICQNTVEYKQRMA